MRNMTGFELSISGVRRDHSANWATTSAPFEGTLARVERIYFKWPQSCYVNFMGVWTCNGGLTKYPIFLPSLIVIAAAIVATADVVNVWCRYVVNAVFDGVMLLMLYLMVWCC